jgi:hypothetical protein
VLCWPLSGLFASAARQSNARSSVVGPGMEAEIAPINGHGLLTMPDAAWELARRRAEVIALLAG